MTEIHGQFPDISAVRIQEILMFCHPMMTEANPLLESYLMDLRLPAFLRHCRKVAEDAAQANLGYDRYLLALAEQEIAQREKNRQVRLIKAARFPVLKELADFDFSCVPSGSKQQVLELAQGGYIRRAESILMVGNPGLGKTHAASANACNGKRQVAAIKEPLLNR